MSGGTEDKKSKRLLFLMIFALLLINAGLIYQLVNKNNKLKITETELVDTTAELDELKEVEDELRLNLAEKAGKNAELDSIIQVRDAAIQGKVAQLRRSLSSGNLTKAQLAKAKKELSGLKAQVATLESEIERLSNENRYLRDEKYVLQQQVDLEKEKVAEMVVVNTDLAKQVEVGSRIFLKGLEVKPLRDALFGDFKTTDKVSKLNKIDITYTLANNDLADKGEKMLYFQIVKPGGAVLVNKKAGSGIGNFDGGKRQYSVRKVINFQNSNEKGSLSVPKTEGMNQGKYVVNVFSEEHKMGSAEFTLR
ncbi:hypothetical protein N9772_00260 [Bacteroidia bacterium]|nr:hypothetical protein [Bacteroidia bacterium]